ACLSGDLKRPGAYEVPRGTSLRELVEGLGGGPLQGKTIEAVQVGGSSGAYLPASKLDLPLEDTALAPEGAHVGVGAVMAISERVCLYDLARRESAFFAREAAEDCIGCQKLGSLAKAVEELGVDPSRAEQVAALAREIQETSRCHLGRRAVTPVASLLRHFPASARVHAEGGCGCSPRKKPR
ncbi:MAG: SLBB domain-containing protein, partial [Deltaproteobacteria bacterium]|nr:SLBB domain-containing protein [Deltaproteobacteria bacterium]